MAAEGKAPLALGQVASQTGAERASLHQPHDVLVREPLGSDAAGLLRHGAEYGPAGDPPEPQPGLEQGDRAGVRLRAPANLDLPPPGLAADDQERTFRDDLDPAGAVLGLIRAAVEPDDFGAAQ